MSKKIENKLVSIVPAGENPTTEHNIEESAYQQYKIFVSLILDGVAPKAAVKQAQFQILTDANMLLERPEVRHLINSMMRDRMATLHAPRALKFMVKTMRDTNVSDRVRVDCAKHLLSLAGYQPPKVVPTAAKPYIAPSEMTSDELQREIDRLQGEAGYRASGAKIIEGVPAGEIDIFS